MPSVVQVSSQPTGSTSWSDGDEELPSDLVATDELFDGAPGESSLSSLQSAEAVVAPREYANVNRRLPADRFDYLARPLEWPALESIGLAVDWSETLGRGAYGEVYRVDRVGRNPPCDSLPDGVSLPRRLRCGAELCVKTLANKPVHNRGPLDSDVWMGRVAKEIHMLKLVQGGPNIVAFGGSYVTAGSDVRLLLFERIESSSFNTLFLALKGLEIPLYLYKLLAALDFTHSRGLIHRDVKGGNILYNRASQKLRLIDWGFAEFYFPDATMSSWPGTRNYKAPELFLHYRQYSYAVDMWAFGCVMGTLVLKRFPLFSSAPHADKRVANRMQLASVVRYLGLRDYEAYLAAYDFPARALVDYSPDALYNRSRKSRSKAKAKAKAKSPLPSPPPTTTSTVDEQHEVATSSLDDSTPRVKEKATKKKKKKAKRKAAAHLDRVDWRRLAAAYDDGRATDAALDLLDRVLVYDHTNRLTAAEAMRHPYFDEVRSRLGTSWDKPIPLGLSSTSISTSSSISASDSSTSYSTFKRREASGNYL
ncbi:CMGC/CK2 protein kinase [Thecamonas trahens ATCC 50062]|uniref:non-specific serine/threonine protein kinase n=1 Tax=Thecamonas trahens ATCC 50062 TaxID=461836 RepID=A0A0L0DJS9_THETB|nr:CMGC/CK2 protein kinase [Thecamonas trahens ATCC 50062]KNC51548.1 CMGC/CK2 protein kinase [Thecamonas trahens ATCC 50062]|eukprot:XP_013755950.1 CMGC/CK2 protein kinase [Thecamonas trahens ATCC 50062]